HTALENNLRWMDVQLAMATENNEENNEIISGFTNLEKKVGGFSSDNEAAGILQSAEPAGYKHISGNWASEKEIRDFAKELFHIKDDKDMLITKSGKGAEVPLFTVSYEDGKTVY